jgi:uncharacterized protein YjbI with pentapeptide repeats
MGKVWRLLVESGLDDGSSNFCAGPVGDTSRETRLLAAKHLPALLEKLIETAEAELQDVEANTDAVKSLVQIIRNVGSDLKRLDLLGAAVVEANMPVQKSRIVGSNLNDVDFVGAKLADADLAGSYLRGTKLVGVKLADADLAGADLVRAKLVDAYVRGTDLARAKLAGADLAKANTPPRSSRSADSDHKGLDLLGADVVEVNPPVQKSRGREVAK